MESKGRLVDCSRNIFSGKWRLTFEVEDLPAVDDLQGKDLRINAKQWREKRSLNANAYAHVLMGKIAEAIGSSMTEVKNHLLSDWGQLDIAEDGRVQTVIIRDDIAWEKLEWIHLRPTASTRILDDKRLYRVYYVIRGSSTYDSREMSRFLDGVVQEAKSLGIEVLTPAQLQTMNMAWRPIANAG